MLGGERLKSSDERRVNTKTMISAAEALHCGPRPVGRQVQWSDSMELVCPERSGPFTLRAVDELALLVCIVR